MGNPRGVRRDFDALERRRFQAHDLLQQGFNQSEVARRVTVCPQTVSRWAAQVATMGKQSLKKAGRAGRKPLMSTTEQKRLVELLKKGPERLGYETPLWTCWRVAHLIEKEFEVKYHRGHVWKVDDLGWSCQRPVGRARERNEEEIRRWRRVRWPGIKKKPKQKGVRSSSSTGAE